MTPAEKRVEKSMTALVLDLPWWATLSMRLRLQEDPSVTTFSVDGKTMRFNPAFLNTLDERQLVAVDCHEVAHLALGHHWRLTPERFPDDAMRNKAADYEVNALLEEANTLAASQGGSKPFPPPPKGWLNDPEFAGVAAEIIYETLRKRAEKGETPPEAPPQETPDDPEKGDEPSEQEGQGSSSDDPGTNESDAESDGGGKPPEEPQPDGKSESGSGSEPEGEEQDEGEQDSPPSPGEFTPPPHAEREQNKREWEQAVIQACKVAKGDTPGSMARLVEKLTRAGPDWRHLIRDFCQRAKDDYSFAHPNERYSESEFWLPGLHSERPGRMVFAVDTSGSTEAVVGEFLAQAQVVLDEFRPEQMDVFWCDAAIQKHEVYYPGDDIPKDAPGGGGTDFRPVFEAVKDDPPVCLVYLTDLEGSFPDVDPGIPTLWVVWGGCKDAPTFGDVAHVEDK